MAKLSKKELVDALDRVRSTVSSSEMIQIYRCFCFRKGSLMTFNGQAGSMTEFDISGQDFAVPADKFYRLMSAMGQEIDLTLSPKGVLMIKSGKNSTKMNTLPAQGFPNIVPDSPVPYSDSRAFVTAMKRIAFSVCDNATKPQLLGIGARGEYLYSADGTRVSRFKIDRNLPGTMLIPADAVDHLVKLGQPDQFLRTPNQLLAYYGEHKTWYVTNLMVHEFPFNAVDEMFATMSGTEVTDFPETLPFALDRIQLLAPQENTDVIIECKGDGSIYVTSNSEFGEGFESIEWLYPKSFKVAVNPAWLKKAFESSTKVDLTNIIHGDKRAFVFTDADGFQHVCALMALRESA